MTKALPRFRTLTQQESQTLLGRHHTGRLAFTFHDQVDIEPISYVFADKWLYARTAPGTKLVKLAHNPWVAFEVDEVTGPFDWKSVVVRGTAYFITPHADPAAYEEAVNVLRSIDPRALTHEDLVPERSTLFRIHADSLVGRAAATS